MPHLLDLDLNVTGGLCTPPGKHDHLQYFSREEGEHYSLLRHLAKQFTGSVLVDIGTHLGLSALALSESENRVLTLDIEDKRVVELPSNVQFELGNMVHEKDLFPLGASLAVLDIDPHAGEEEKAIVQQLLNRGWKGLLVCDDIHLNTEMEGFWSWVCSQNRLQVEDVTYLGHCTGTGLVQF